MRGKYRTRANPCNDCQYPIGDCPWLQSRGRIPVLGWAAEKDKINGKATYHILHCPLYIPPSKERLSKTKDDGSYCTDGYTRYCIFCGKPIPTKSKRSRYCSEKCMIEAAKERKRKKTFCQLKLER